MPNALNSLPPSLREGGRSLSVLDMHTAGEPVRIVLDGYPELKGASILDKRQQALERFDPLRRALMLEPRGHAGMYGVIPVEPSLPDADLAVLFMHNSGYSTMCGHAVIAIGRWAVETGLVALREPVTTFGLECPCGLVQVASHVENGRVISVGFDSVPAFVAERDVELHVPAYGRLTLDIAYGGAFYAILPTARAGLTFGETPLSEMTACANAVFGAVTHGVAISHPTEADLGFLYGVILTDDRSPEHPQPSRNLCVFGAGQIDRSPTGSGVTARLALAHAKGEVAPGLACRFEGPSGIAFAGCVARAIDFAGRDAVVVSVEGQAHYSGESRFVLEDEDALRDGFSLD